MSKSSINKVARTLSKDRYGSQSTKSRLILMARTKPNIVIEKIAELPYSERNKPEIKNIYMTALNSLIV